MNLGTFEKRSVAGLLCLLTSSNTDFGAPAEQFYVVGGLRSCLNITIELGPLRTDQFDMVNVGENLRLLFFGIR